MGEGRGDVRPPERGVARGGHHLQDPVKDLHQRHVARTPTKIDDQDELLRVPVLTQSVGQRRGDGFLEEHHGRASMRPKESSHRGFGLRGEICRDTHHRPRNNHLLTTSTSTTTTTSSG